MVNSNYKDLRKINITQLSCTNLKKHVTEMLENSSHCKAILECVNQDTGEYRIVLEGIIETETYRAAYFSWDKLRHSEQRRGLQYNLCK